MSRVFSTAHVYKYKNSHNKQGTRCPRSNSLRWKFPPPTKSQGRLPTEHPSPMDIKIGKNKKENKPTIMDCKMQQKWPALLAGCQLVKQLMQQWIVHVQMDGGTNKIMCPSIYSLLSWVKQHPNDTARSVGWIFQLPSNKSKSMLFWQVLRKFWPFWNYYLLVVKNSEKTTKGMGSW